MMRWEDKPLAEREYPDPADLDEGEPVSQTLPCPRCSMHVFEDAEHCPHCGYWISRSRMGGWRHSRKLYVRFGLWASRTILLNWLFWPAVAVLALLVYFLTGRGC